jgi:hypothetical protein
MGEGDESNPCFRPIFDETIHAPVRRTVQIGGGVIENNNLQTQVTEQHLTIGHINNFLADIPEDALHFSSRNRRRSGSMQQYQAVNEAPSPTRKHRHTKSLTDLFCLLSSAHLDWE